GEKNGEGEQWARETRASAVRGETFEPWRLWKSSWSPPLDVFVTLSPKLHAPILDISCIFLNSDGDAPPAPSSRSGSVRADGPPRHRARGVGRTRPQPFGAVAADRQS